MTPSMRLCHTRGVTRVQEIMAVSPTARGPKSVTNSCTAMGDAADEESIIVDNQRSWVPAEFLQFSAADHFPDICDKSALDRRPVHLSRPIPEQYMQKLEG